MSGLLVVTAVPAERDAIQSGLGDGVPVHAVGVGQACTAAATARLLAGGDFSVVISAGVGGGFAGRADVGTIVLALRSVAADLGADAPEGFITLERLGFGASTLDADAGTLGMLRQVLPDAVVGDVLTVNTVTGTAERTMTLLERHPDAAAEAMEGFGAACAAAQAGVAFAEIRTISNVVGPRDRNSWRIPEALQALSAAGAAIAQVAWDV
jgi:futalosine hydrolase